jgi:PTS system ascorbate-specific IIC component
MSFSGGFMVVVYGIRLIISEIIPAFNGFAEKIIPGTRPAMDVPTVFPFGANSVIVGAVVCILTFIAYSTLFNVLGWGSIVPIVPSLFMSGAGAAVYGNKFGGARGAVLGGFVVATMMAFGLLLAWHLGYNLGVMDINLVGGAEPDDFILWPIIWGIARLLFGPPLPAGG